MGPYHVKVLLRDNTQTAESLITLMLSCNLQASLLFSLNFELEPCIRRKVTFNHSMNGSTANWYATVRYWMDFHVDNHVGFPEILQHSESFSQKFRSLPYGTWENSFNFGALSFRFQV